MSYKTNKLQKFVFVLSIMTYRIIRNEGHSAILTYLLIHSIFC